MRPFAHASGSLVGSSQLRDELLTLRELAKGLITVIVRIPSAKSSMKISREPIRSPQKFWRTCAAIIISFGLIKLVIYPLMQRDYMIVKNHTALTISKITVNFGCNIPQKVVFMNIEAGNEVWKPGNRRWGDCGSSRGARAEGKLNNDRHIGPKSVSTDNSSSYFIHGDRFTVEVNEDGSVKIPASIYPSI